VTLDQRQARGVSRPAGRWASERGRRKVGTAAVPRSPTSAVYPEQDLAVVVLTNQRKLFPNLAQGVARLYLPATKFVGAPAIADTRPELTARLSAVIRRSRWARREPMTLRRRCAPTVPEIAEWLQLRVGGLPAMTGLELLSEESANGPIALAMAKTRTVLWDFTWTQTALIEEVDIRDE
jgi:hypothetical protein